MASPLLAGFWTAASVTCALLFLIERFSPVRVQALRDLIVYGKTAGGARRRQTFVQRLEIPKQWFTHFYVTGVVVNTYALFSVVSFYVFRLPLHGWILFALDALDSHPGQISTDGLSVVLLVTLMLVQNTRRLWECLFVSVYSSGTMSLIHYALGIILYSTFFLAVLVEAPYRTVQTETLLSQLSWRHVVGVLGFCWASWHHHRVHVQFAAFRKDASGAVLTLQHTIPYGGLFELVSCPHYTMECLIYACFILIGGGGHVTLASIAGFVWTNQIVGALETHKWYRRQYKSYPFGRKAIIPYVL